MIEDLRKRYIQCDEQGNIIHDIRVSGDAPEYPRQFQISNDEDLTGKKYDLIENKIIDIVYAETDFSNIINPYNVFDLIQAIKDRDQRVFDKCDKVIIPNDLLTKNKG